MNSEVQKLENVGDSQGLILAKTCVEKMKQKVYILKFSIIQRYIAIIIGKNSNNYIRNYKKTVLTLKCLFIVHPIFK